MSNQQIHKRFSNEQVKTILESYVTKEISAKDAKVKLEIGKSQFFELTKKYKQNKKKFTIAYQRKSSNNKIDSGIEKKIIKELEAEKKLIENKDTPVNSYNYSFVKDNILKDNDCQVSLTTIINRARDNGYYQKKKKKKKIHDQEVISNFIGELIQKDSSHHQFSPYMNKLYLITAIDDYSRLILFADLFFRETTWNHIMALEREILTFGCPLKYYVDQHSIFKFVRGRDRNSAWHNINKLTDDVTTQFKQVLNDCSIGITYALSPQAKGKIERPYRWIQDRLVRIAARKKIDNFDDLKKELKLLINDYNTKWIHSTTGEIPIIRFEKSLNEKDCLFKPLTISKKDDTKQIEDIFALRIKRFVDAYRNISLDGLKIRVPNGLPRDKVSLRIRPQTNTKLTEIRFWKDNSKFLGSQKVKTKDLKIVRF